MEGKGSARGVQIGGSFYIFNACYVGETCRHFSTRVSHLVSDRAS